MVIIVVVWVILFFWAGDVVVGREVGVSQYVCLLVYKCVHLPFCMLACIHMYFDMSAAYLLLLLFKNSIMQQGKRNTMLVTSYYSYLSGWYILVQENAFITKSKSKIAYKMEGGKAETKKQTKKERKCRLFFILLPAGESNILSPQRKQDLERKKKNRNYLAIKLLQLPNDLP
jgi:hypothetical protein